MAYCLTHGIDAGTFPKSIVVRHKCDNPVCCNPNHLEPGTQADNVNDKVERGRILRGQEIANAILTEEDIPVIRARMARGDYHHDIALDYGVSRPTISQIGIGKSWAWVA